MANDLIEEGFNTGGNGATITTVNTTANSIFGTAPTFSNAQLLEGAYAARFNTTAQQSMMQWDFTAAVVGWFSFYLYMPSTPPADTYIASFLDSAGLRIGDLRVETTGVVAIRDNFLAVASTTALASGTWHRIAVRVTPNTANGLQIRTYEGGNRDGLTPDQDVQGNSTRAVSLEKVNFGVTVSNTWDVYLDRLHASSTEEPAPDGDSSAPSVPTGLGLTSIGAGSAVVYWTESVDDTNAQADLIYHVYVDAVEHGDSPTAAGASAFTLSGLAADTEVAVSVSAEDTSGFESGVTSGMTIRTPATSSSGLPAALTFYGVDVSDIANFG